MPRSRWSIWSTWASSWVSWTSSPEDGSSASSSPGSAASARANSTRRQEPSPNVETGESARSSIPTSSSTAFTRSRSSGVGALMLHRSFQSRPWRPRDRTATTRWSRTVMSGKISTRW